MTSSMSDERFPDLECFVCSVCLSVVHESAPMLLPTPCTVRTYVGCVSFMFLKIYHLRHYADRNTPNTQADLVQ